MFRKTGGNRGWQICGHTGVAGNNVPRYSVATLGPVTAVTILSATTHMIYPFASIGNGFDTGFVIANTSADPYGTGPGAGGARPISGPATLVFFPASGAAPFCLASGAGAPGTTGGVAVNGIAAGCAVVSLSGKGTTGLSAGGNIAAGSSWVFLGSEALSQLGTGGATSFTGYVFAIANFPVGHPTAFVADATFSGKFTSGGPALVIPNPAQTTRQAPVESVGH